MSTILKLITLLTILTCASCVQMFVKIEHLVAIMVSKQKLPFISAIPRSISLASLIQKNATVT